METVVTPDDVSRQRRTPATVLRAVWRRASAGWLLLAALCFLMPFVTVSCDVPGGFGTQRPGGSTTYRGVDLVTGGDPQTTAEHARPPAERRSARLGVQPFAVVALALTVTALAASLLLRLGRARRIWVAATATAAALALVLGQLTVRSRLAAMVAEEAGDQLPPDRRAIDFVHNGDGFWVVTGLLVAVATVSAALAMREGATRNHRSAGRVTGGDSHAEGSPADGPVPRTG